MPIAFANAGPIALSDLDRDLLGRHDHEQGTGLRIGTPCGAELLRYRTCCTPSHVCDLLGMRDVDPGAYCLVVSDVHRLTLLFG